MPRVKTRKRPCAICRRWFTPDPRQIGRQKTCGPDCQRELHRRQCADWNRKNKSYFKAIYLAEKIERAKDPPPVLPASRSDLALPEEVIVETTGPDLLIILEYIIEQVIHRRLPMSAFRPP